LGIQGASVLLNAPQLLSTQTGNASREDNARNVGAHLRFRTVASLSIVRWHAQQPVREVRLIQIGKAARLNHALDAAKTHGCIHLDGHMERHIALLNASGNMDSVEIRRDGAVNGAANVRARVDDQI
jgi:hypothetical protein